MAGFVQSYAYQVNILGGLWRSQWADQNLAADALNPTHAFATTSGRETRGGAVRSTVPDPAKRDR